MARVALASAQKAHGRFPFRYAAGLATLKDATAKDIAQAKRTSDALARACRVEIAKVPENDPQRAAKVFRIKQKVFESVGIC